MGKMKTIHAGETPFSPEALNWPSPDMSILKDSRPTAPTMDDKRMAWVYGPWAGWIRDAAEVKNAPADYVALGLITTAAACIGNSRHASPQPGWKEPSILWGMLVGEPSAHKSPALDATADVVKEIELGMSEEYNEALELWEDKDEVAAIILAQWKADAKKALSEGASAPDKPDDADAGKKPIRKRVRVGDITTEKLADLLANLFRGLLMSRDELAGWIASMDRYSGGGDRQFWLEAFGGRSYTVDRKNSPEPIIVHHMSVSILGGTQPDKLESLLVKADDDGLLARFLIVHPEPAPLAQPRTELDDSAMKAGLERLLDLSPMQDENGNLRPFYVPFTTEAQERLFEFRKECRELEKSAEGPFKGHIGKMPGLSVRVALVLAFLDYAFDGQAMPTEIGLDHMERACWLVGEYFRFHAYRAYGVSALDAASLSEKALAKLIYEERLDGFKVFDVTNRQRRHLRKTVEVKAALGALEERGWLISIRGEGRGRPSITYKTNPALLG